MSQLKAMLGCVGMIKFYKGCVGSRLLASCAWLCISSLPISFFAVVQVKKAGKSEKATSQKTQVGIPKKLATRLGYKKLEKAKQKA